MMIKQIMIFAVLVIGLMNIPVVINAQSAKPIIIFDKAAYNPFATVKILIVDPSANIDKGEVDAIQALVHTRSNVGNIFKFTEVAPNAGVFQAFVKLTPLGSEWPADVTVQKGDELIVEFNSKDGKASAIAKIDFTSLVMFDRVQYTVNEEVKIFVLDTSANKMPDSVDTMEIQVWSTSDVKGIKVTLNEISNDIGIFSGKLSLAKDRASSDSLLRVANNDVITAKYTQKISPPPSKPESTAEVRDIFAAALVEQKTTTEFIPASDPEIVNQFGDPVSSIELGQVIIVQDIVVNYKSTSQRFAYIVLIKDLNGITISLSWLTGELPPSSSFKAGQSWIPNSEGEYDVQIFLWQSIENPVALAPSKTVSITVAHPLR